LEDALTPEIAASAGSDLAEVVLIAADTFGSMLSAYRGNMQLPDGQELLEQIVALARKPVTRTSVPVEARFAWSEYDQMVASQALTHGKFVYNICFTIDPRCPMRAAAMQLIRNVLQVCGELVAINPDQSSLAQDLNFVEALITSDRDREAVAKRCLIPSVVTQVAVQPMGKTNQQAGSAPEGSQQSADPAAEQREQAIAADPDSSERDESSLSTTDSPSTSFSSLENLLRVDAERIDTVLNLVGELIIAKSMLHQAISEFDKRFPKDPLKTKFADAMAFQARIMNDLQKSVMKIRMVPVEQLFRRFPRLVRDVGKSCGKDVNLVITGQDTDLDKSILDMLAEPIAHLVRNSVDHGIESPENRVALGKPSQGTVKLAAYHQGNQIVIEVSDDGRGIDREKLVGKAIERGILAANDAAALSEQDVHDLIFHPGLSTAEQVTAISGRGVGMDVVQTVLERLKGNITIDSVPGKGTTFSLKVPLTLAIIKALLFRVGARIYAVPLASVVEITRVAESEVHRVDRHDVIRLRDEVIALLHLEGEESVSRPGHRIFVVVVSLGERKYGLVVERLIGEEELVIKALDDHLVATDLVSGASILGDGTVVLILNIASVVSRMGRTQMVGATA